VLRAPAEAAQTLEHIVDASRSSRGSRPLEGAIRLEV
jgi:hypothetical protein